jgi:hypothetical protein
VHYCGLHLSKIFIPSRHPFLPMITRIRISNFIDFPIDWANKEGTEGSELVEFYILYYCKFNYISSPDSRSWLNRRSDKSNGLKDGCDAKLDLKSVMIESTRACNLKSVAFTQDILSMELSPSLISSQATLMCFVECWIDSSLISTLPLEPI